MKNEFPQFEAQFRIVAELVPRPPRPNDHLNRGDIPGLTRLRPGALCPSVLTTDQEVKALRELPKQTGVVRAKNMSVAATEP
jgi:hypothetical protein